MRHSNSRPLPPSLRSPASSRAFVMAGLLRSAMLQLSSVSRLAGPRLPQQVAVQPRREMATAARASVGKKDLVAAVAEKTNLTAKEAEGAVNAVIKTIVETVAKGEKVQVVGFGTFEPRTRAAHMGRNPQTGEQLSIPETTYPAFSAGKAFKDSVKAK